jgi:hypothetical protein
MPVDIQSLHSEVIASPAATAADPGQMAQMGQRILQLVSQREQMASRLPPPLQIVASSQPPCRLGSR